jgi:hypothetical protein
MPHLVQATGTGPGISAIIIPLDMFNKLDLNNEISRTNDRSRAFDTSVKLRVG